MSKIRLGTTNIDFKTKMDVNRIFTSVVVAITPAGGLMVRLSIGTSLGALAAPTTTATNTPF